MVVVVIITILVLLLVIVMRAMIIIRAWHTCDDATCDVAIGTYWQPLTAICNSWPLFGLSIVLRLFVDGGAKLPAKECLDANVIHA